MTQVTQVPGRLTALLQNLHGVRHAGCAASPMPSARVDDILQRIRGFHRDLIAC